MKSRLILSLISGTMFGIFGFIILIFIVPEDALMLSLLSGIGFSWLLYMFLYFDKKHADKKFAEAEKNINSEILYKCDANLYDGKKFMNGNLYFCKEYIVFICVDKKPYIIEKFSGCEIDNVEYNEFQLSIYTNGEKVYLITTTDTQKIMDLLKDTGLTM